VLCHIRRIRCITPLPRRRDTAWPRARLSACFLCRPSVPRSAYARGSPAYAVAVDA
jgi:hypothetical protein